MPEPTPPPPLLDYAPPQPMRRLGGDRLAVFCSGVVFGLIGVGIALVTIGLCVRTWPSFGMTLVAVPVELVAVAFISVGVTAVRATVGPNA